MNLLKVLSVFLFFCISNRSFSQETNSIGAGNGLEFNGVNNYVELGDIYDDLYPPFTISAWIYLEESVESWAPIFVSQDNSNTYQGTTFLVSKDKIGIEYGDGRGWNNPQYRRSKGATVGNITNKWIHVAGIIRSATDMDLYVNGLNVYGTYSGSSPYSMANKAGDVAKIGTWYSNSQYFWFKGKMDELRVWNYSRSQEEIRRDMCKKLEGNETGLIGYWRFDEIAGNEVRDYSNNKFHGQLTNGVSRIVSGASIGDSSINSYSNDLSNESIKIGGNTLNELIIDEISGNSQGIHLYRIDRTPVDTFGIDTYPIISPYYGLFVCNYGSDQVEYNINLISSCNSGVYFRENNSDMLWNNQKSDEKNSFVIYDYKHKSQEIVISGELNVDLGADTILCPGQFLVLDLENLGYNAVEWNDGSSDFIFTVDSPGIVWAKVYTDCGISLDTIEVNFGNEPFVSLGNDISVCDKEEVKLSVNKGLGKIAWQDGSTDSVFIVKGPGEYWVQVENQCGISLDTIEVNFGNEPFVSLGNDISVCNEEEVKLSVNKDLGKITWQDGSSDSVFIAKSPGTYWVQVENQCGVSFDTVKIESKAFSGVFLPNVVTPNGDNLNDKFYINEQITGGKLIIYNRWGRPIYSSESYRDEWPNANIHSGVYYYLLNDDCSKKKYKGFVHVLK